MAAFLLLSFALIGLFGSSSSFVDSEENDYEKYKFIQINPRTDDEAVGLMGQFQGDSGMVEVMKQSRGANDSLDLLVHPNIADDFMTYVANRRLSVNVKSEDFREMLQQDRQDRHRQGTRRSIVSGEFDLYGYNSYEQITQFQIDLARTYRDCVTVHQVGTTYEGRPMLLTKISKSDFTKNPIIFIDAGMHAREWVAPALAVYIMDQVARSCRASDEEDNVLSDVDWLILPVANPDGYEFSKKKNRMWRKTRSRYVRYCHGVDGNRNYGFKWGSSGVSTNPCDLQTYAGPRAFSENETKVVRDILLSNKERIKLYVSLHAYGQYLVYPWGYTGAFLPDGWQELDSLANEVSAAVVAAGGDPFKVTSAGRWYAAAGASDDYAFGVAKVPYSYTMELTDGYEFIFPERLLKKALPEYYEGFRVFREHIANKYAH